jgi:tetratricopeptide (TPR) repeat protein
MARFRPVLQASLLAMVLLSGPARAQDGAPPETLVPDAVAPSAAVLETVTADYLTDEERKDFRVLHTIFDDLDLDTPARRAFVALERWRLDDPSLADPSVERWMRAEALLRAGKYTEVVVATESATDLRLLSRRAAALAALGKRDEAAKIAASDAARAALRTSTNIEEILAAVDLGALRIRLDATAADEYRSLLATLARAREQIDRLDARIRVREARLLADRGAMSDALHALDEALSLSPRNADAWRLAGELALARFEFTGATNAATALRRLDPDHPFAAFLDVRSALMQHDPDTAEEALDAVFARGDVPAEALAWRASLEAARFQFDAMRKTLAEADARAPGSAEALVICGRQLSFDRQYAEAREILERAAERETAWSTPRAELGLLSMQDGREARAVEDLRAAVALDPNDERTVFTLKLAEQLAGWKRIETKHFIIRHPEGDAALVAQLLAGVLDGMHESVCARLAHEPSQKTLIDVMPDHRSFGVRITGQPRIHTIAVCTGPSIAIEIPKDGPQAKHLGLFDPLAVLRHEYTHTVTLSMTKNRIPHWLTEAVAVTMEDTPRTFDTCQMLAAAWQTESLFDLDEINWAFIRPRKQTDRAQAYAQGRWMVEYIERTFGWEPLRKLLFSYAEGIREDEAMRRAFGVSRADFYKGFKAWAAGEVRSWGLACEPSMRELALELTKGDDAAEAKLAQAEKVRLQAVATAWSNAIGRPGSKRFDLRAAQWPSRPMPDVKFDDATVRAFLAAHPEQADLVEILLRRARASSKEATDQLRELLERYAKLRPVDPYPHRVWAKLATDGAGDGLSADGDPTALAHLRELDIRSDKDNVYALAIARNRRAAGDLPAALESAERAVRMNPFDPSVRELAAAIAVEGGRLERARVHIEALVVLEPDRPLHKQRLERVQQLLAAPNATSKG